MDHGLKEVVHGWKSRIHAEESFLLCTRQHRALHVYVQVRVLHEHCGRVESKASEGLARAAHMRYSGIAS